MKGGGRVVGVDIPAILISLCNRSLENITSWTTSNRLKINVYKTNCSITSNLIIPDHYLSISLNNRIVTIDSEIKLLGGVVDSSLKFKNQISQLCKIISKSTGIMRKLKRFLPIHTLILLYHSLIHP